jgi:hypothetical protein
MFGAQVTRLVIIDGSKKLPLSVAGVFALVDASDWETVSKYRWTVDRSDNLVYAYRRSRGRKIYLHRELMSPLQTQHVDHISGDGLDNRRVNLRLASRSQNLGNMQKHRDAMTSKYKGVSWDKARGKWVARLMVCRVVVLQQRFTSEMQAARAYDAAASKWHGVHARGNFR